MFNHDYWLFSLLPINKDSLRKIDFPNSSYAIGDLIIELAESQDDTPKISQRKKDKIKRLVETELDNVFIPESESVVTARRLNGAIQYSTYLACFFALMLLLLQYLETILPNSIIRQIKSITLTKEQISDAGLPFDNILIRMVNGESLSKVDESPITEESGQTAIQASSITYKTPWYGDNNFESYHHTNSFYVAVSDHIRQRGSLLGAKIDAPILRYRRVAAHAVENTEDTSIVPSFLEVQKESILAMNDGKTNLIRFLIWAIPTIGFIGTVVGISEALTGTVSLQSSRDLIASAAQSKVSSLMGMAFDTTLIALFGAFIVMFFYHLYLGAEAALITRERDITEEEVMRTVRVHDKKLGSIESVAAAVLSMQQSLPILNHTVRELHTSINSLQGSHLNQMQHIDPKDKKNSTLKTILLLLFIFVTVLSIFLNDRLNLIEMAVNFPGGK